MGILFFISFISYTITFLKLRDDLYLPWKHNCDRYPKEEYFFTVLQVSTRRP